jgi:hypothetical protein
LTIDSARRAKTLPLVDCKWFAGDGASADSSAQHFPAAEVCGAEELFSLCAFSTELYVAYLLDSVVSGGAESALGAPMQSFASGNLCRKNMTKTCA